MTKDVEKARKRAGNDAACACRKLIAWAESQNRSDVADLLRASAATIAEAVETLRNGQAAPASGASPLSAVLPRTPRDPAARNITRELRRVGGA